MRSKPTFRALLTLFVATASLTALASANDALAPIFLADDPVVADHDTRRDAGRAVKDRLSGYADFVVNLIMKPGDRANIQAMNVNTLDEVPDSSWFTNRIGARAMTLDELARGPNRAARLDIDDWVIVAGKSTGRQAGFVAVSASDPGRQRYQIEFDPKGNPEMATGAEIIGTAIYHAIGFNVVETYLVDVDPARLSIAPTATVGRGLEKRRFMKRDLEDVLGRSAKTPNGRYRATASRYAEGRDLGPFRYYGTRPDDPNDIYPHEHRRELRGNRVFCAWLNHDDSRAVNSLDMLVGPDGQQHVKHYMFDFGSMLGSGTNEEDLPWVGHEYVVEPNPGLKTLGSFGLWRRPFTRVQAPAHLPAAGNFTADRFVPDLWKPHYPNAAFTNMREDDAFWAARIVSRFSDEAIRRIVETAAYSDPAVTDHMIGTLIKRRDLVLRTWLTRTNPVAGARVDEQGRLRFDNAAADAGVTEAAPRYDVYWFRFDNETGARRYVAHTQTVETATLVPEHALAGASFSGVEIRTLHDAYPPWEMPVRFYFRGTGGHWRPVGVERVASTAVRFDRTLTCPVSEDAGSPSDARCPRRVATAR